MTQVQTILHLPDGNSFDVIQTSETLVEAMVKLDAFVQSLEQDRELAPGSITMTRSFQNPFSVNYQTEANNSQPMADGTKRAPKDWGRVKFMPKSADLVAGDKLECPTDYYKFFPGERIEFWSEGGEFPALSHGLKNEVGRKIFTEIFGEWNPTANKRVDSKSILIVECAGETSKKNPYKNLKGVLPPDAPEEDDQSGIPF
jgi:hypothetical protein